jgi:hypothetical protein
MRRTIFGISVVLMLAAAACSGGAPTAATTEPPAPASPSPSIAATPAESSPSPSASPITSATAIPTTEPATPSPTAPAAPVDTATPNLAAIKPCSLVTTSEADAISGTRYAPGATSTSGGGRICTYIRLNAHASLALDVKVAPSPAAAQQAYAAAELNASSFTVTQVTGVGDGAFIARTSLLGIESSTIDVLRGAYFFAIAVISVPPGPTDKALEAESLLVVGRLS